MNDADNTSAYQPNAVPPAPEPAAPPVIGRYRVERVLGRGGFGRVYLAHDDHLHRPVAIKVPHPHRVLTIADAGAYLTEARTVANLDHPHIVPVYDVGSTPDCPCFIVSKFIAGRTLSQQVQIARPTFDGAAEIVATVAEALHYAHHKGVVHRDVKPANILIDPDGKPFVVDFGLALKEENAGRGSNHAGTPAYMSPEQARGEGHRVDGRSDVFSLGVIFYELLCGRQPFRADSYAELMEQIAGFEPRPPRQCDETVPKELERICLKALAKRASERYLTAKDMADDLRHFLTRQADYATTVTAAAQPPSTVVPSPSTVIPVTPPFDSRPLRIVPKGLRSFDTHDADFFLELLPGPRDRDGLPEGIRFWKTRIEEPDADQTFAVGLICGPSGCGKSSLVKAGLLPRLSPAVTAVYVEATAGETESRLLNGLRKRYPTLGALSLKDTLATLRRGEGQKVVLVLDQFEQWLHAKKEEQNTELVQALRQCDGGRVQCVVMVRDDFWMAVIRFMRELEVPILEGRNSAAVDLFDLDHARKVLTAFGRAFGKLPERTRELTAEHKAFVNQAVAGLAQEGKVVSVRLSLFAEMMKGKAWTPAALKAVGGIAGVGATFLEETFGGQTAPPKHRYHQKAARAVLKALLPESGTDIKGHMRSYTELLESSGYRTRPEDFEDLLRILDGEVRLITPTDPDYDADATSADHPGAKYFQLTHDYLVPALRDWLTRKQKETRRGRAELLLVDRAAVWAARPESRQLPSFVQWLGIRRLVPQKNWTAQQREMMRTAARHHARRGAVFVFCLIGLGLLGWEVNGRLQARTLRDRLLEATTTETPTVVADMAPYRRWVDPLLREAYTQAAERNDARKQLHVSLALLPVDEGQVSYLSERLLTGTPQEVTTIRTALRPHAAVVRERLWEILVAPRADSNQRMRAACALAMYAPNDGRWEAVSDAVVRHLASENPLLLKEWAEALRPIGPALLPALADRVAEAREPSERRTLNRLYAEFAAVSPDGFKPLERLLAQPTGRTPETAARRRATAAAALAAAGRWTDVWPLLRHTPDPTTRTYLIERLGTGGADVSAVVDRLGSGQEPDVSVHRAMVLALADFGEDCLPAGPRDALRARLRDLYLNDPDPGVHGATGWLLRQWGQSDELQAIDRQLAAGGWPEQRGWYVTGQYQTMTVVPAGGIEVPVQDPPGRRKVRAERRFALGAHEVTVAEFLKFREHHKADERSAATRDCPVNLVTWFDAAAYCNWLSRKERIPEDQWCYEPNEKGEYAPGMRVKPNALLLTGYRLPTEAEWEYACRAGSVTRWSMGGAEDALDRYGWSSRNAGYHTHPGGLLRPNDLGLFDMHGNVWEWCQDRAESGGNPDRVDGDDLRRMRGGTYINNPPENSSAIQNKNRAAHRTSADGFRLARTLP